MRKLFLLGMLVVVPFVFAVQYSGTDVEEMQKEWSESYSNHPCECCDGKGRTECTMCDGTGWRICSFCGGEGTIDRGNGKETCANCNGKGQFKCGYCKNGERICTCCNGTGKQRHVGR